MEDPLVTVIIPTCNREQPVLRAIRSVQAQTHQNLEIFVVDDCSKDSTVASVRSLGDPRIRVFEHKTNRFAGAARNTGMQSATGELIAFLDSDDTWEPKKIERQVSLLQDNPQAGFCLAGVAMQKGRGYREKSLLPRLQPSLRGNELLSRYMLGKVFIITSTLMFRRSLLEQVGMMDEQLRRNQDIDFFIRLIEASDPVSIEEPLTNFFPNEKPPNLDTIEKSNYRLLSNNADRFEKLGWFKASQIRAFYRFAHGKRHVERGRFWKGLRWIAYGVVTNPILPARQYASAMHKVGLRVLSSFKTRSKATA